MSALAHYADSSRTSREVREVPEAAVSNRSKTVALFDHLVGGYSRNGSYGISGPGLLGSLRLEASKFGNLAPLLGLCGDELPEASGRHRHRHTTQIGEPHFQRRIG